MREQRRHPVVVGRAELAGGAGDGRFEREVVGNAALDRGLGQPAKLRDLGLREVVSGARFSLNREKYRR